MADNTETKKDAADSENDSEAIEITFFKSDTCAFCPRAEEVVRETIGDFEPGVFKLTIINVSEDPEAAEEFGVFALPTVMIGGVSITGIPEPELLMKMILGSKFTRKGVQPND